MRVLVATTSKSARGDRDRMHQAGITRSTIWPSPAMTSRCWTGTCLGVHGDEVCRRLAAERSQSRILMLTAAVLSGIESTSVPQRGGTARSLKSNADHAA